MKILLIGSAQSSRRILTMLLNSGHQVVGLITRPGDAAQGDWVDLRLVAQVVNVPTLTTMNANDTATADFIDTHKPEVILCIGWNQLIKPDIYNRAALGAIGFHPAALPKNRGRHPIIWALVLGLSETASTFFRLDPRADAGAILSQNPVPILAGDQAQSLYDRIMQTAEIQLTGILNNPELIRCGGISQNLAEGNSWRKRSVADGKIDWRMSSTAILNLIRGLSCPYPGAHFLYREKPVKIWRSEAHQMAGVENLEPGKVLQGGKYPVIKTGDGCVRLLEWEEVLLNAGEYL